MARPKKDVVKVTYTIDRATSELIDKYNAETDIPKSKIIEQSVNSFIGKKKQATKAK